MHSFIQKYPKNIQQIFEYGTSGFRDKSEKLDYLVFRMGILASLRSRIKNSSAIGLMITASHNPEPDNGVKLIDPFGEMLEQSWESFATKIANIPDEKLKIEIDNMAKNNDLTHPGIVFIGRDTRPSSSRLVDAAIAGVKAYNGQFYDQGVVTTPILHYLVHEYNTSKKLPSKNSYFVKLSSAFNKLFKEEENKKRYKAELDFDASNGVGALSIKILAPLIEKNLKINIYNDDINTVGKLNNKCGSDHVKSHQTLPEGFTIKPNQKIVSVDGDADRVVYSYLDENGIFHLLDGDKISVLVAEYLLDLISKSGLNLNLGIVQTAYSNGNCTKYILEKLKIPVSCTNTGVKHLHHKASEYDVGIYFESNGHGTVIFSQNAINLITQNVHNSSVAKLKNTMDIINSIVGDAISDMLLIETILYSKDYNIQNWQSMYTDLPNKLLKVSIMDRNTIKTTDADRKCTYPPGLQDKIDIIVSEYKSGRSFVRPSGTENVVRVYAEAATQEMADEIALRVSEAVNTLAGFKTIISKF